MDLEWTRRREAGVAFVACRLVNEASVPRRARLANRLDGPVLPPRRGGVPEVGWDADGVTVAIGAGATRAVGYACPVPPEENDEPPIELVDIERAEEAEVDDTENGATPAAAIRKLGDHRPPRAACDRRSIRVGASDSGPNGDRTTPSNVDRERTTEVQSVDQVEESDVFRSDQVKSDAFRGGREAETRVAPAEPAAVEAWLDAVERRVVRAERLDGADVATATEVLAAIGGAAAAADLVDRVETDADRLAAMAERAEALAERAAATEAPTDALDQLA